MGDFTTRGRTVLCKWCNRQIPQDRRWFPRQYCNRRHKWKHRITETVGSILDSA
ncbi:hypothetical protein ACFWFZ_18130 [Streptomyces sp. NPDC060232]|uniref:hypothetical protein n=1 Tax=Streptomyces sp. NPDC060232 TaxID=3347079 RepID=UPI0036650A98